MRRGCEDAAATDACRTSTTSSFLNAELITFRDAASGIPPRRQGRPAHVGTLHRWRVNGLRGVRLPARRVGGVWMTSWAALNWFFDRLTAGPLVPTKIQDSSEDLLRDNPW